MKKSILFLLALLMVFTAFPHAAWAADVSADTFAELQRAIANASEPTNIIVGRNIIFTAMVTIPAGKDITIKSAEDANSILTVAGGFRHFAVNGNATLTLEDITLDGDSDGIGYRGGIANSGSLKLNVNAVITNCYAYEGGGINNNNGTVIISGGEISGNTASNYGGGIYTDRGAITFSGGKINGNIVIGQSHNQGHGGGIYNNNSAVTISGGEISGNTANYYGGGIYNGGGNNSISTIDIYGGEISGNTAEISGGGIYNYAVLTIYSGKISGNNAMYYGGGGIYNTKTVVILGGEISGNSIIGEGGGICNSTGALTISGGEIKGNSAGNGGGVNNSAKLIINGGKISGNNANNGGGIYCNVGNSLYECSITVSGGEINGNSADIGGGIYNDGYGTVIINGGKISGNEAAVIGGGLYIASNSMFILGGAAVIKDNTIGIDAHITANNINLANNRYITLGTGASVPLPGMDIGVRTDTPTGIIVQNGANNEVAAWFHADEEGKKVAHENGRLVIVKDDPLANFCTQVAAFSSAASDMTIVVPQDLTLKWAVDIPANAEGYTLTITSADKNNPITLRRGFSDDEAGNGLLIIAANAALILENIIIDGAKDIFPHNSSPLIRINKGGALTMNSGTVLQNNRADNGGGIYNNKGQVTVNGGEISGNTAAGAGGGIWTYYLTDLAISQVIFNGNTAAQAYWMTDPADITTYNTQITGVTGFSTPPAGNKAFAYAYNNYDIYYIKGMTEDPEDPEDDYILGDINGDGRVNLSDLSFLAQYFIGGYDIEKRFPKIFKTGDMDRDGKLELNDLCLLVNLIVNSRVTTIDNGQLIMDNGKITQPDSMIIAAFDAATPVDDGVVTITVPSIEGKPGERVMVPVYIEGSPGVKMFQLAMLYDNSQLEFISQASGSAFAHPASLRNGGPIQVDGDIWEARVTYTGDLLDPRTVFGDMILCEFEFEIRSGAAGGGTRLSLKPENSYFVNGADKNVYPQITAGEISIAMPEEIEVYDFRAYMEAAQTSLKAGDTLLVDVILTGGFNYTQFNTAIAYDAALLEFAGYEYLGGLVAEVKRDGADNINVRSVASVNMLAGAPCVTPLRMVTLKFTVKDIFAEDSITTDLSFTSIAVIPAAGITGVTIAPGEALRVRIE